MNSREEEKKKYGPLTDEQRTQELLKLYPLKVNPEYITDMTLIPNLGSGSFGTAYLTSKKDNPNEKAVLKCMHINIKNSIEKIHLESMKREMIVS